LKWEDSEDVQENNQGHYCVVHLLVNDSLSLGVQRLVNTGRSTSKKEHTRQ